jgi:hypothetical protein
MNNVIATAGAARSGEAPMGRGRRRLVRVIAVVGLLALNFLVVFVITDAWGRVGEVPVLEPPGSVEAQIGAAHPGEAVHLAGAIAALVVGVSGLGGLIIRPERAGSATHAGMAALAWLIASVLVGDPDNYGGQAGVVDLLFAVMAVPALAAAVVAAPWRSWRRGGVPRPGLLALAALGLPWVWHGIQQGLMQRNTWPPLADPHHQAHYFSAALVAFMAVLLVAGGALAGRGWRVATAAAGAAGLAVAAASLVAPDAASALHPGWAAAAGLWGVAVLAVTWRQSIRLLPRARVQPSAGMSARWS